MFRRLVLVLVACVAPFILALFADARPASASEHAAIAVAAAPSSAEGPASDPSADLAEDGPDAFEEDVAGFEPAALRAPTDPRASSPDQPREVLEPARLKTAVLTRPPA